MYKLSVEFKSIEELGEFITKVGGNVISGHVAFEPPMAEKPEVIKKATVQGLTPAEKAKATRERKKIEAEVIEEEEMEEIESPYSKTSSQAPALNREAAIAEASSLVQVLRTKGLNDSQIIPEIHSVFDLIGAAKNLRISELDDSMLSEFLPLFSHKVGMITGKNKAAPVGSFI